MHEVKATRNHSGPKRKLNEIRVKRMGNGFAMHKEYEPQRDGQGMRMPEPNEPPQVFTKHAPLHKAFKAASEEMHDNPMSPPSPELSANSAGGESMDNQAPVATNLG